MSKKNRIGMSVLFSLFSLFFIYSMTSRSREVSNVSRPSPTLQVDGDPVPPFPVPWLRHLKTSQMSVSA